MKSKITGSWRNIYHWELRSLLVIGSLLLWTRCVGRSVGECPSSQIFTNCTSEPCSLSGASGFSVAALCGGGAAINTANQHGVAGTASGLENITCANDYCGGCFARYFATDGAEVSCDTRIVTLCQKDSPVNISCAANWKIKVWYAVLRSSRPDSVCAAPSSSSMSSSSNQSTQAPTVSHHCSHSVLYQVAKLCDGRDDCLVSVPKIRASFDPCEHFQWTYIQLDYSCYGAVASSSSQLRFFTLGLILIGSLFPLSLLVLLITVQIKKHYRDAYAMSSLHLPLTDNENPEL